MDVNAASKKHLRIWETALLIGLAVFLISGMVSLQAQQELSEKVVRLHVLANSDSAEDQALKLRVRDVVLEHTTQLLEDVKDRKTAEGILRGNLLELERLAEEELQTNGFHYPVNAELSCTEFSTRKYQGFAMPAGEYLSLRIMIGEGSGQNWWCVVFPPLCTAAATDFSMTALAAGFSEDEVALLAEEPGYVLRFKTVELWETLKRYWEK
jgi:stage II sporulation protein R